MKANTPHIYKVGEFWFCKIVWRDGLTHLGVRSSSPKDAFINFLRAWRI